MTDIAVKPNSYISASDVDIVLSISTPSGGKPTEVVLGYMQDLQATEMFHIQPIRTLFNPLVSGFVPGVKECHGTARRAFIEWNNTMGLLDMVGEFSDALTQTNNLMQAIEGTGFNPLGAVVDTANVTNAFSGIVQGAYNTATSLLPLGDISALQKNQFSIGDVLSKVAFDLVIRYPMYDDAGNFKQQSIWRLKKCFLDSRAVVVTVGNVIVLEEISFVFQDFKEEHWNPSDAVYAATEASSFINTFNSRTGVI